MIGDHIAITVVRLTGGGVRLGIEAPAEMPVVREELKEQFGKADAKDRPPSVASSSAPRRT